LTRRALRRFTRAGWLVLTGLTITGALGANTEQTLAYQAFALLAGLAGVAMASAPFFRGRFAAQRHLPRFGTVGVPLKYSIQVRNLTPQLQQGLTLLERLPEVPMTRAEFTQTLLPWRGWQRSFRPTWTAPRPRPILLQEAPLPILAPGAQAQATVECLPLRRGALRFEGVDVARTDPFGLFRAFVHLAMPQTVLVLPRRYPLPALALPGTRQYQRGGVAMAWSVGESEEFVSVRDYRRGDPLRRIHWRSWARTGRPIVKEFEDEFFVRHALILDTFAPSEKADAFEEAVSVATSFACTVQTQDSLLDLLFVGPQAFCFTSGRGVGHTEQMLEILASVQPCRDRPFAELERLVVGHAPLVNGCVCVLLAWDEARRQLVRRLKELALSVTVFVVVEPGAAKDLDRSPSAGGPDLLHALEVGQVAEELQRLRI
jgi:uncharacterized protein (DUF58 family)